MVSFVNWAGTVRSTPTGRHEPESESAVVDLVRDAASRRTQLKAVGAGHSWSDAAATSGGMVSLDRLADVLAVDLERSQITVAGGIRLHALQDVLNQYGLSLPVLGSISVQSIAGATATGTHGSSLRWGGLATAIVGMRMVAGTGDVIKLSPSHEPEMFNAARVAFGALGIVSAVTLQCVPQFDLQEVARPMRFDAACDAALGVASSHEFAKLWWLPHTSHVQISRWDKTKAPRTPVSMLQELEGSGVMNSVMELMLDAGARWPSLIPRVNRFVSRNMFRAIDRVDDARRVFNVPQVPSHREIEYAIPVDRTAEAMRWVRDFIEAESLRVNFIVEVRFAAADDLWMSPASGRATCHLGAYMAEADGIERYFRGFEAQMLAYGGRPHWGKEFAAGSDELRKVYPRYDDFVALRHRLDPRRVFANDYTRRVLGE